MTAKPWSEERRRAQSERAKAYQAKLRADKSSETPGISTPIPVLEGQLEIPVDLPHNHQWLAGEYVRTDRGSRLHTIYCATGGEWKTIDD